MNPNKYVLVTGGEGFLGRYVCKTLREKAQNVISLDLEQADLESRSYPFFQCNISDPDGLEQVFSEYEISCVVHLASMLNTASRRNPEKATRINVLGSLNLLEAARKFNVTRIIYGSSISIYGTRRGKPTSEEDPPVPEDLYGTSKQYVEKLGQTYREQFGLEFVALRIATVVGPGARATSSPWRSQLFEPYSPENSAEIQIPCRAEEELPLIFVGEVAAMIEKLVATRETTFQVYNTPAETWKAGALKAFVEELVPGIRIHLGEGEVRGIPGKINGDRFINEFNYSPLSLKDYLQKR